MKGVAAVVGAEKIADLAAMVRCNVLISFGNPFGNAVGDTVLATQHIEYVRRLLPNCSITVWTSTKVIWSSLSNTRLYFVAMLGVQELKTFDLIIIDWARVGPDFIALIRSLGKTAVIWPSWGQDPCLLTGDGEIHRLTLPPCSNQPGRIPQLYSAFGVSRGRLRSRRSRPHLKILLQPSASILEKSLPVQFIINILVILMRELREAELVLALPPKDSLPEILLGISELMCRLKRECITCTVVANTSMCEFIDCIASSSLVISPDSSGQHIAALTGTPCIALYSSRSGYSYYFYGHQYLPNIQMTFREEDADCLNFAMAVAHVASGLTGGSETLVCNNAVKLLAATRRVESVFRRAKDGREEALIFASFRAQMIELVASRSASLCRAVLCEADDLWRELQVARRTSDESVAKIVGDRAKSLNFVRIVYVICRSNLLWLKNASTERPQ